MDGKDLMANINEGDGIVILDLFGGCNFVVDHHAPHLGGNMAGGDEATKFDDDLFPWLVSKFAIQSVLDVGCAEGHAMRAFRKLGVVNVLGLEGLHRNAKLCGLPVIVHDLTLGPCLIEGVEWVWCSDVAEHIEERFAGNLLQTLACGKFVAMAQGDHTMSQSGWHHVNNKPEQYWIDRMKEHGLETDEATTQEARTKSIRGLWPQLGRIYRNVKK